MRGGRVCEIHRTVSLLRLRYCTDIAEIETRMVLSQSLFCHTASSCFLAGRYTDASLPLEPRFRPAILSVIIILQALSYDMSQAIGSRFPTALRPTLQAQSWLLFRAYVPLSTWQRHLTWRVYYESPGADGETVRCSLKGSKGNQCRRFAESGRSQQRAARHAIFERGVGGRHGSGSRAEPLSKVDAGIVSDWTSGDRG